MSHTRSFTVVVLLAAMTVATRDTAAQEWINHKGPIGGDVRSIAVDLADANEVYVGVVAGGQVSATGAAYKSTDGGATWTLINNGLTAPPEALFTVAGTDTIYAATDSGVFKTTNGGLQWNASDTGITHSDVRALVGSISTLYAGTYGGGVFRSTDDGATWVPLNAGLGDLHINDLARFGINLYAATPSGLFRSFDGGVSWSFADVITSESGEGIGTIALDPSSTNNVFVTAFGASGTGVWRSVDFGNSWTQFNTGLPDPTVYALAIDADDNVFAGTADGIYRSSIGGTMWTPMHNGLSGVLVTRFAIGHFTLPRPVYAGTIAGLSKSTDDGMTWTTIGLPASTVSSVMVGASNGTLLAGVSGAGGGVFKSVTSGASWVPSRTGMGEVDVRTIIKDPANPARMYAGTPSGVFTSVDAGNNWSGPADAGDVVALAIDPSSTNILYAGTVGDGIIFKSTDAGATWTPTASLPLLPSIVISGLAVNPSGVVYAGTFRGVYKSNSGGASWTLSGLPSLRIRALAISPLDATRIYAATDGGGLFISADGGGSWDSSNAGISDLHLYALAITPASPSTMYAASADRQGVFKSVDSGQTWNAISDGLPLRTAVVNDFVSVLSLAVSSTGDLYAGTDGAGVSYREVCGDPGAPDQDSDGLCDAGDNCPTVFNPGQVDSDDGGIGDGVGDECDNCPLFVNPDQRDSDTQAGGDVCDPCPSDATDLCNQAQSGGMSIDSGGGTVGTPDGSVSIEVPPGAVTQPTTFSITGGIPGSAFGVRTGDQTVAALILEPSGITFAQPVLLTFRWRDFDDNGFVDAQPGPGNSGIREGDLRIWRDGAPLLPTCQNFFCIGTGTTCCDRDANRWKVFVSEFSEYIMGAVQCSAANSGLIKLSKLDPPAGDDKVKLLGDAVLPVPISPSIDPTTTGAHVMIDDAAGQRILSATIPGGLVDPVTRIGWKANRSNTSWRYTNPDGVDGITSVKVKLSSRAPGAFKFRVKGKHGSLAVSPSALPLRGRFVLDPESEATGQCGELEFPGLPSPTCTFDPSGSSVTCR